MAEDSKSVASSKTMWVGLIGILAGVLNEVGPLAQQLADQEVTRTAFVSALVMMILRAVTKSPLVFPPKK